MYTIHELNYAPLDTDIHLNTKLSCSNNFQLQASVRERENEDEKFYLVFMESLQGLIDLGFENNRKVNCLC